MLLFIRCFLLLVIFLLIFLPLQSSAAVYKCPRERGKTTFQDRPCKAGKEITIRTSKADKTDDLTRQRLQTIKAAADNATLRADKQSAERLAIQQQKKLNADLMCKKYAKEEEYWETQQRLAHELKDKRYFYAKGIEAGGKAMSYCGRIKYY